MERHIEIHTKDFGAEEVSVRHGEARTKLTSRGKKTVATLAMLGAGLAGGAVVHHETAPTPQEQQIENITESPANIPAGHEVKLATLDGQGAEVMAQHYAAPGQYENLKQEIEHEYVDGQLPSGMLPAYDKFVDQKFIQPTEHQ